MRYPRNAKIFRGQLDMAPWASMLFLLLMLFLIKIGLFNNPGLMLELPETDHLTGIEGPAETVLLDSKGHLYYLNRRVEDEAFVTALTGKREKLGSEMSLVLHADRGSTLEDIVRVGNLAREAGISRVLLAARTRFPLSEPLVE